MNDLGTNDNQFGGDLRTALHRDADLAGEPPADLLDQLGRRRSHQRRTRVAVLGAVAAVVVIASGIPAGASLMTRSDGNPATQTPEPAPPSVSPSAPTPPSTEPVPPSAVDTTPSEVPGSDSATTPPSATPSSANSGGLVLGPDGLGALTLGMSRSEAEATGLVEPFRNEPNSDRCLWRSRLSGAPAGTGTVLYSETFGVATVDAYAGVQTPEGIGIGSSLAAVALAYPDWRANDQVSRGVVAVPGSSQLVYRIAYANGQVTELTLQYGHQDCYE